MRCHRTRVKRRTNQGKRSGLLFMARRPLALGYLYGRVSDEVLCRAAGQPVVRFRQMHHRWSRVALLDVDLSSPEVRVEVAAAGASPRRSGCSNGGARTVADWCRATGAVGGINGGFFGRHLGPRRKGSGCLLEMDRPLNRPPPRPRYMQTMARRHTPLD